MVRWFTTGLIILFAFAASASAKELCSIRSFSQQDTIIFLDSNLHVNLDEVKIVRCKKKRRKHYQNTRQYWRMVRNIRIVYPYAEAANETIGRLTKDLEGIESKKQRRKLIRKEYNGLMKDYKKPLMKLKISQGKLMMKLIDRETGNTSYNHLKELKGSFAAIFWQSVAAMFGSSLKAEYDPLGDDWMIEEILDRMKRGELPPPGKLPMRRIN